MKLKMKLMAAAVALAASAGANAAITNSVGGNGELFFTIYDVGADLSGNADDRAYVRDLGSLLNGGTISLWGSATTSPSVTLAADKQYPGVQGTINQPPAVYSIGADANLQSFLSASTDLSRLKWNIAAVDSSGTDRVLTTAKEITTTQIPNYTNFRKLGQSGADVYLAQMNPALTGESALYSGAASWINLWGDNFGGYSAFNTAGGINEKLGFFMLSEKVASGSTTTLATVQQYMGDGEAAYWHLSATGDLTYNVPAIPEPSEYALMLAGLGMLGFMARRRLNNRA
jgi:hypothetical protein